MTLERTIKELEGMIRADESEESSRTDFLGKLYLMGKISGCRKSIEILMNALDVGEDANDAKGSLWDRAHRFDLLCTYGGGDPDLPFLVGSQRPFTGLLECSTGKGKSKKRWKRQRNDPRHF